VSPHSKPGPNVLLRLLPTTALVFSGYLIVSMEAAAVPSFVHRELGLSTVFAGFAISAQFVATLLNRPFAGSFCNRFGPRVAVLTGLAGCAAASLLLALSSPELVHSNLLSWILIVLSRLLLGLAISWVSTAGTVWGIGRTGSDHTAQVVAWSGVASYGALSLGAPVGLWTQQHLGLGGLGLGMAALAAIAAVMGAPLEDTPAPPGQSLRFGAVLSLVAPFGLTLALAASGFGCFLALTTLMFESHRWPAAALPLSIYGVCFVAVRLLFARQINRFGAYSVTLLSIALESIGLLLLATAQAPGSALVASALIGIGFSLVFPALCVQAIAAVRPRDQASAVSLYTGFIELSFALTSAGAGLLAARIGFASAFFTATGLAACAFVATLFLRKKHREALP
jgi:predicted MFS family arabinose efflux permease